MGRHVVEGAIAHDVDARLPQAIDDSRRRGVIDCLEDPVGWSEHAPLLMATSIDRPRGRHGRRDSELLMPRTNLCIHARSCVWRARCRSLDGGLAPHRLPCGASSYQ